MDKNNILKEMKKAVKKVRKKNAIEDVLDNNRVAEMSADSIENSKQGVMSKKDEECNCKGEKDCECDSDDVIHKTEYLVKSIINNFKNISDFYLAKKENKEKPFHGYNKEKHSKEGGLSEKERNRINREEGSNLKAPVSSKEAKKSPKKAARRKSFCARMSGNKGPTSKDGKLTPKGAALKRWDC
jgi:hypothetical protein